jgi:3-oxoacyl-[acyl-carrier-protein] synthase-3
MTAALPKTERTQSAKGRSILGIRISGTGLAVPPKAVSNEDLSSLGCDSDWIIQRTGIASRFHAPPEMATSDLATMAAQRALVDANLTAEQIDMIFVATMTPDYFTPSTACLVQSNLGAKCGAIDMNAACSGFMYALVTAGQFAASGNFRNILVVGADKMTFVVDPQDVKTFPLFGDGAAAVVLSTAEPANEGGAEPTGLLAFRLGSEGELGYTLIVPGGCSKQPATVSCLAERQQYLKMDGRTVFKWAVRLLPEVVDRLLDDAGLQKDEIDLFVFHQANRRIIDAAIEAAALDPEKVFVNVDRYGNTSGASIPICLHEAKELGHIRPGSKVLMVGFGSGLTWGGTIFQW